MEANEVKVLRNWWFRYIVSLLLILTAHAYYGGYFTALPVSTAPVQWQEKPFGDFLDAIWQGKSAIPDPAQAAWLEQKGLCWVSGFKGGYEDKQVVSLSEGRATALKRILSDSSSSWHEMEAVEVGVATNVTSYNHEVIERSQTGLWGILLRCSSGDLCLVPAQFSRRGQFPDGQSIKYQAERNVQRQAKFQASTWVLRRDQQFHPSLLVRGEPIVQIPNREAIEKAANLAAGFQQRQLEIHNGLLPFAYSLSTGLYSEENRNLCKVCLGSLSMASYAALTENETDRVASEKHLKAMIARFGHQLSDRAFLSDGEAAPLGAQGLFSLAIHKQLQLHPDPFLQEFEAGLTKTLTAAVQKDGHLLTACPVPKFSNPYLTVANATAEVSLLKDEDQNDQPVIALSYLADRCTEKAAPMALKNLDQSLEYYLQRFDKHPQRNAVPWLATALMNRYQIDKTKKNVDSAFRLIDWNLDNLQNWAEIEPQLKGGLLNPDRLQYGKECTTADVGTQLSALVQASKLAKTIGDSKHTSRYDEAILQLSRYLIQMQIRSRGEIYWLPATLREAPLGGLRDSIWEPNLQIDSSASAVYAWSLWLEAVGSKAN